MSVKNKTRKVLDWRFLVTLVLIGAVAWFFYQRTEASAEDRASLRATIGEQKEEIATGNESITALRSVVDELRQRCADADDCDAPSMEEILANIPAAAAGQPGIDGRDGRDGSAGTDGRDGFNGVDGQDGEPGAPGAPGADGPPGKDGAPGADGKDGAPGKDGQDGQSAYPFTFQFTVPGNGIGNDVTYTVACTEPGNCTTS
jgi:hypothetical protein